MNRDQLPERTPEPMGTIHDLDAHRRAKAMAAHPATGPSRRLPVDRHAMATAKLHTYLFTCLEFDIVPRPDLLAAYRDQGVDVAGLMREIYG